MKKTIILLAAATLTTSLCAQTQNHLKFNGIPINGSISSFAKEMVNLNYEFMEQNEDTYFFTGRDECIGNTLVVVACLPENAGSTVFAVMMTSPAQPSFNSCEAIYKRVQKNLDKNYGEGYYEEVINPEDDKDDLNRMIAIVKGTGHYVSNYLTDEGSITLSIMSKDGLLYTTVAYVDKLNGKKAEKYLE